MSPVTRVIDPAPGWQGWLVIVPGAVDNMTGVSVPGSSPWAATR
jgi:hypothetical protein